MPRSRFLTLASALLLVACTKGVTSEPVIDLVPVFARQELVWNAQGMTNYTMEQERLCYCSERKKARLTVRNGVITDAVYVDTGDIVPPAVLSSYYTIPGLFTLMRAQYAASPNKMDVLWHATLGYPAQISVDPVKAIADDEWVINTSAVVKLTASR